MKIGVRAHDYPRQSPETLAMEIKKAGFDAVQLAPCKALDLPDDQMLEPKTIQRIRQAFFSAGLEISVLGCYVEPGSMDESIWQQSLNRFKAHIRIAKALGAKSIATETTRFSGTDAAREAAYLRVLAFVREAVLEAEEYDTLVAVEPVFTHTIHTPELAKRLLTDAKSSRLGIVFDPVNLLPPTELHHQEALWSRCIDCFGSQVIAMHIKNGCWEEGAYLPGPLSEGVVNLAPVLDWVRTDAAHLPLLREEAVPSYARADIQFLRQALHL